MYKKILEATNSLKSGLATKILWQEIFCAVFFEEEVIIDILECENFEWRYVHFKENYDWLLIFESL